jgi:hypothetical protein
VLQFWWELFEVVRPYAKIAEYGIIFATIGLGIFAAGRIRASAREMRQTLDDAVDKLKGQSQEIASDLEAAGLAAIERIRAKLAEDREEEQGVTANAETSVEADAKGEPADAERRAQRQAHDKWWQPVVEMKFSDPDQVPPRLHWKNNVRVPLPWRGTWLTGWRNDSPDGVCGVALSGTGKSIDAFWRRIRGQAAALESELPEGSTVEPGRFGIGIMRPNREFRNDDERRAWLIKNLDRFAGVLRPRMKALIEK